MTVYYPLEAVAVPVYDYVLWNNPDNVSVYIFKLLLFVSLSFFLACNLLKTVAWSSVYDRKKTSTLVFSLVCDFQFFITNQHIPLSLKDKNKVKFWDILVWLSERIS